MADTDVTTLEEITDLPEPLKNFALMRTNNPDLEATLESVLPGNSWASVRDQLQTTGEATYTNQDGGKSMMAADFDSNGRVMNIAAAIPRNPGRSYDYLKEVEDFKSTITTDRSTRVEAVAFFHKLVRAEGIAANAVNKMAALIACDGSFKIKSVRGKRGVAADTVSAQFEEDLNWWKDNVNANSDTGVITGDRGITAFLSQGARLALIEGDHIARHLWSTGKVTLPNKRTLFLPMNLQSYSSQHIEIPSGLEGTGTNYEIMYWKPPRPFVQLLTNNTDPDLKKALQKVIPSKVKAALIKDGRYLLDPALLIHVKHRGLGIENFGQSLLEPAMADFRYKRALDALEIVTITNLINRVVILKVGSDNEKSAYHKAEVTGARLGLLQRIMRNVGPSATILWGGPDLSVQQVSAHDSILDLADRYKVVERRLLMSLGVPSVLMIGEGGDGKAVGYAAALAMAAQLQELQNQYRQALVSLAAKIGEQNGFLDLEVIWEFSENLLDDKQAAAEMIVKLFSLGLLGTQTALEELGFDHAAEETRQQEDLNKGYKTDVFGPPLGAQTNNIAGTGGGDGGRPTNNENPTPDPRKNKEAQKPN